MRETWYVLENGAAADPNECAPDEAGLLRHNSGVAVAINNQTPMSRGVDVEAERAKQAVLREAKEKNEAKQQASKGSAANKEAKPTADQKQQGYVTREQKSE
jgi:hypothetical protein